MFKFGGMICYCGSYLELLFRLFEIFRLYAILFDAAKSVRVHTGKGSSCCYRVGGGPN